MAVNESLFLVEHDKNGVYHAFREDVLNGLKQSPKAIPARWLYDETGSQIFEDITELPEYYPTRAERQILVDRSKELSQLIRSNGAVVEFGSGSSLKTPLLLSFLQPSVYVPIDISGDYLRSSALKLSSQFPGIPIYPVEADFLRKVELPEQVVEYSKLGFFPGSTIGNMVAGSAVDLLRSMRETLGDASQLLIGMDIIKDPKILLAAYDDKAGITAKFNLNVINRINRELNGNLPIENFRHEARWNNDYARIEMHLVAKESLQFSVSGEVFTIAKGESLHTENSHKYNQRTANILLQAGGWTPSHRWLDNQNLFSLILADATIPRSAP